MTAIPAISPLVSFVAFVVKGLVFRSRAMAGDVGDLLARFPWHVLRFTRACHHFAVSGIRPVYSVSDVPDQYPLTSPPGLFQLSLQTQVLSEIDPWVTQA